MGAEEGRRQEGRDGQASQAAPEEHAGPEPANAQAHLGDAGEEGLVVRDVGHLRRGRLQRGGAAGHLRCERRAQATGQSRVAG